MTAAAMETLAPVNWLDLRGSFLTLSLMTFGERALCTNTMSTLALVS